MAAAAAICAKKHNRPVRIQTNRNDEMKMAGNRHPFYAEYKVGASSKGKIIALDLNFWADGGYPYDASFGSVDAAQLSMDNVYNIDNYRSQGLVCRTNLPTNTSMRAPGTVQAIFIIESVIDDISRNLKLSADLIREVNYYKEGDVTPTGQPLNYFTLPKVLQHLQPALSSLKVDCEEFNAKNRWRKRGISMIPHKYGIGWTGYDAVVTVNVIGDDGTIFINQSGTEIGQGLYTKVAQVVAYSLGVDLSTISVGSVSTEKIPNFGTTGGSGTSETCCQAALIACDNLKKRLESVKSSLPDNSTWKEIVSKANSLGIDLSSTGVYNPLDSMYPFDYFVYSAAVSQVEIDVLTGEINVLRSDISYDCGRSLNPAIDIGQIEGAFIMGLGFVLTEERVLASNGKNLTAGTWEYKPPSSMDIPIKFNVSLLDHLPNPIGIMKSKATGEPPYSLAFSVFFAVKDAVSAARRELVKSEIFQLECPATVARVGNACGVSINDLQF